MLIPCDIIFQCLYSIFFVCSISYFLFKTIHPEKNLSSGAHIQNLWSEMIFLISSDMTGESPTYGRWREYMEQHSGFAVRKKWTGNTKDSLYPVGQENPLLERERMYPCNMERKKMWFLVHPIKKNNKKRDSQVSGTVCPRSSYPIYIVSYYIKWVTTFWTHRMTEDHTHF